MLETAAAAPADAIRLPLAILAAAAASVVNAIAGGGTLLTFPALIALGIPPITANATSTVALLPGALSSMLGYRRELSGVKRWLMFMTIPSLLGGAAGAWLLLVTPADRFDALVPFLVLGATALFMLHGPVLRFIRRNPASAGTAEPGVDPGVDAADAARTARVPSGPLLVLQGAIGIYGGYFGAGIGILMLAGLGFAGFQNIHRMNGLKNWLGFCMNFVAAVILAANDAVDWPVAIAMTGGAVVGGYGGSVLAQYVGPVPVRRAIVGIGLVSGLWLLARRLMF